MSNPTTTTDVPDDAADQYDEAAANLSSSALNEKFSQQQAKISALKELVRQSEATKGRRTASAKERASSIAERLTNLKSKSTRGKHGMQSTQSVSDIHDESAQNQDSNFDGDVSASSVELSTPPDISLSRANVRARRPETPGSEKIQLLRRQMEENRARMAEREHSNRDVEQLITQLKAKFDSSQYSLDRSTSNVSNLGRSIGDLSLDQSTGSTSHRSKHDRFQSSSDLSGGGGALRSQTMPASHSFDRERIRYLEQRCTGLEEQLARKEREFVERNVTAEQSQRLSALDAEIIDLREQLREKDSLIEARTQAVGVVSELGRSVEDQLEDSEQRCADASETIREQGDRIASLEQANEILETARFELTVKTAQLEARQADGEVVEIGKQLAELQRTNEKLLRRIGELETQTVDEEARRSDLDTVVSLTEKVVELNARIEELHRENDKLRADASESQVDSDAREHLEVLRAENDAYRATIDRLSEADRRLVALQAEIEEYRATIEKLNGEPQKNASDILVGVDAGEQLAALQAENEAYRATIERLDGDLQEKATELQVITAQFNVLQDKLKTAGPKSLFSVDAVTRESDEGEAVQIDLLKKLLETAKRDVNQARSKTKQLQKKLDTLRNADATARRLCELSESNEALVERVRELEASSISAGGGNCDRLQLLETTCSNQKEAIRLLEEQKLEISNDLQSARKELLVLHGQASSIDESDRSAQVSSHIDEIVQEEVLATHKSEIADLKTKIASLSAERDVLSEKLNHYIVENMELVERWEKFNNGSSAESIEIVENLTASEHLEMECIERGSRMVQSSTDSSTLTVMGETRSVETEDLAGETDSSAMSHDLSESLVQLREESSELMERIESFTKERKEVLEKMEGLQADNARLQTELDVLRSGTETNVVHQAFVPVEFASDTYEKSLKSLEALLESYRRGKDKNAKFDVSKKLAKETKNNVELMQRLLGEHSTMVGRVNELQVQITAASTALVKSTDNSAELEKLNAELSSARNAIEKLERDHVEVMSDIDALRHELEKTRTNERESNNRLQATEKEREILKKLVAEQKDQLIDTITEFQQTIDEQSSEIERLQQKSASDSAHEQYVAELNGKMMALKQLFDENNDQLEQQATDLANKQETIETLNAQITEVYRSMEETTGQLLAKEDELSYLQEIIDSKQNEEKLLNERFQASESNVRTLESKLAEHINDIHKLQDKLSQSVQETADRKSDAQLSELQVKVNELETRNHEQLEKLKKFAANLKKKNVQCTELTEKLSKLESNVDQTELNDQIAALKLDLDRKANEIVALSAEIERLQATCVDANRFADLNETLSKQTVELQSLTEELLQLTHEKQQVTDQLAKNASEYAAMTEQHASLERQLNDRNNELSEKNQQLDVFGTEMRTKISQLETHLQQQIAELDAAKIEVQMKTTELHETRMKIEKCKTIIREKNRELKRLQDLVAEHQTSSGQLAHVEQLQQELSAAQAQLHTMPLKLAEHEHFIESLQAERDQLQLRITELEESLGAAQESQLVSQSEAQNQSEELLSLTERLTAVQYEHQIKQQALEGELQSVQLQLANVTNSRDELTIQLEELNDDLVKRTQTAQNLTSKSALYEEKIQTLTDENARLQNDATHLHDELKRQQTDAAAQLAAKHSEIDTLENDLSAQLEAIETERRLLQADLDRQRDEMAELSAENVRNKELVSSLELSNNELERESEWLRMQNEGMQQDQVEVQELRMQIVHDQTENENLKTQTQQLMQTHEAEVAALRLQLSELESLRTQIGQNQTDDQMCIQNENERLQARLATLEADIQQYQRENLQLQMSVASSSSVASASASVSDWFASAPVTSASDADKSTLNEELVRLRAKHEQCERDLHALQQQFAQRTAEWQLTESKLRSDAQNVQQSIDEEIRSLQAQIEREHTDNMAKDAHISELERLVEQQKQTPIEPVIEQKVVVQHAAAATAAPSHSDETEALRRSNAQLEDYINNLQIQLRISTNDCEQLTQTQESLELEIHERTRRYEDQIAAMRAQLAPPANVADAAVLQTIESQIIPATFSTTSSVPAFDGSMFFGHTTPTQAAGTNNEDVIVPKSAYVCTTDADDTEGWGFGSDEAALEEQHQKKQYLQPAGNSAELERQIAHLTSENERLHSEMSALQLKSAKMMKKLKEYKARNDELTMTSSTRSGSIDSSNDLDLAIQEELKSQVAQLEARLKEVLGGQDKDLAERSALQKRVDVLTAANDRMTEMKERQDSDMESCRLRMRQLQQQLDSMNEWQDNGDGTESSAATHAPREPIVASAPAAGNQEELARLKQQCADLQTDNAELQAIVDSEKEHSALLEERVRKLGQSLVVDANVAQEADELRQTNRTLTARLAESVATIDTLSVESGNIRKYVDQLRAEHEQKIEENNALSQQFRAMSDQLTAMNAQLQDSETQAAKREAAELEREIERLSKELDDRTAEAKHQAQLLEAQQQQDSSQSREVNELEREIETLHEKMAHQSAEVMHLTQMLQEATSSSGRDVHQLTELLNQRQAEIVHLNARVLELSSASERTAEFEHEIGVKNEAIIKLQGQTEELQRQLADNLPASSSSAELHTLRAEHEQTLATLAELRAEKHDMEVELAALNDQVLATLHQEDEMRALRLQMDTKTIEIGEMKAVVSRLSEQQSSAVSAQSLEAHTEQLNKHWEQIVEQRCDELAEMWRQHLATREDEFAAQLAMHPHIENTARVSPSSSATTTPEKRSPTALGSKDLQSMQQALEMQELEIVTLKEQLALRSAEYAQLSAKVDPFGVGRNVQPQQQRRPESGGQQRLDLALYMLHQRDMRCEELTEELMSMLDERDSLQMKLAGSLRQVERLRLAALEETGKDYAALLSTGEGTDAPAIADETPSKDRQHKLREERVESQRQVIDVLQRDVSALPAEAMAELMSNANVNPGSGSATSTSEAAEESPYTALLNLFWGPRTPANDS